MQFVVLYWVVLQCVTLNCRNDEKSIGCVVLCCIALHCIAGVTRNAVEQISH